MFQSKSRGLSTDKCVRPTYLKTLHTCVTLA